MSPPATRDPEGTSQMFIEKRQRSPHITRVLKKRVMAPPFGLNMCL